MTQQLKKRKQKKNIPKKTRVVSFKIQIRCNVIRKYSFVSSKNLNFNIRQKKENHKNYHKNLKPTLT